MAKLKPTVDLGLRDGDQVLSADELSVVGALIDVHAPEGEGMPLGELERQLRGSPGAAVLRRFHPDRDGGRVVRQGEAGFTAFLILRTEDILAIRRLQAERAHEAPERLEARASSVPEALRQLPGSPDAVADLRERIESACSDALTREATVEEPRSVALGRIRAQVAWLVQWLEQEELAWPSQLAPEHRDPRLGDLSLDGARELANALERFEDELSELVQAQRDTERNPSAKEIEALFDRAKALESADEAEAAVLARVRVLLQARPDDRILAGAVEALEEGGPLERLRALTNLETSSADLTAGADGPAWIEKVRLARSATTEREVAEVHLRLPERRPALPEGGLRGWWRRLLGGAPNEAPPTDRFIPVDAPVALRESKLVDLMYEGELFGEMSCLNRAPRSADVTVTREVWAIEIIRSLFDRLDAKVGSAFRAIRERLYRRRVLATHMRSLKLFADLEDASFDALRPWLRKAKLLRMKDDEVLFEEGEKASSLFVVRTGVVKVARVREGVEHVLGYFGPGEVIGEIGALATVAGKSGLRTARCVPYAHPRKDEARSPSFAKAARLELVEVDQALLAELLAAAPPLRAALERIAMERRALDAVIADSDRLPESSEVDAHGLYQGQKLLLIDLDRCTRCNECVQGCVDAHADRRARLHLTGPVFQADGGETYLVPRSCRQCLDPVCMIGCPVGSIRKGSRGEIRVEHWCVGCGICETNCPYGSITMHDRLPGSREVKELPETMLSPARGETISTVCDQCAPLDEVPRCVYSCPHEAALRVDARTFLAGTWPTGKRWADPARPTA